MTRHHFLVAALVLVIGASAVRAQFIREQSMFVGPAVCLNLQGSNTLYFGLNGEYMMKRDVGVGIVFRYFTYDAVKYLDGGTYQFTGELIGAQANYHFKVAQKEFDPYLGLVIGYIMYQGAYKNTTLTYGNPPSASSNMVFDITAGARYFITDKLALGGRIAFGANYNALDIIGEFSF
jgi:hypothetical protein